MPMAGANFRERATLEVLLLRIPLPRTRMNIGCVGEVSLAPNYVQTGNGKNYDGTKRALQVAQYNHGVLRQGRGSGNRGGCWTHKARVGKWP
jgi:hypothetical protein